MQELVEEPSGPYHDFWLIRVEECPYEETPRYWGREDAPIRISGDILDRCQLFLSWVPVLAPGQRTHLRSLGLNYYGPNIIDREGAELFSQICQTYAALLSLGPDPLRFSAGYYVDVDEQGCGGTYQPAVLHVPHDEIVTPLRLLSEWGALAAKGEFYILHLGI